jgi:hypothetical protein
MSRKVSHSNIPTKEYLIDRIKDTHRRGGDLTNAEINGIVAHDLDLLEKLDDIKNVNEIIGRLYDLGDASKTTWIVQDSGKDVTLATRGFGDSLDNWKVIFSSGNNLDCLFHSFLTATCANFRRLAQEDKKEFANFFRRNVFLELPVVKAYKPDGDEQKGIFEEMKRRIRSRDFLQDPEIYFLAAQFKFRIFSARSDRYIGNTFQKIYGDALRTTLGLDKIIHNGENSRDRWPTICIFTNGAHYESIRVSDRYELTAADIERAEADNKKKGPPGGWECPICHNKNPRLAIECSCGYKKPGAKAAAKAASAAKADPNWDCSLCTFKNPGNSKKCQICEKSPPAAKADPNWDCSLCTFKNPGNSKKCQICEKSPPAATTTAPVKKFFPKPKATAAKSAEAKATAAKSATPPETVNSIPASKLRTLETAQRLGFKTRKALDEAKLSVTTIREMLKALKGGSRTRKVPRHLKKKH